MPEPGPGQVRVRVSACGVCRTDLHLAEGDLAPRRPGRCPATRWSAWSTGSGPDARSSAEGDRIGIPWLARTCGTCRFCLAGAENLCTAPTFTGWDVDGGYAEFAVVDERYAYRLPDGIGDVEAAPLLCAGIIGYRALRRAELPPGGRLGIYGFGGSAHLTAQVALAEGATVHVMTRSADARRLALELGAASAQGADDPPPEPLDAAILFAPVGTLGAPGPGGPRPGWHPGGRRHPPVRHPRPRLPAPPLRGAHAAQRHGQHPGDGREFLAVAADIGIRVSAVPYPLDRADRALADLAHDRVDGAAVLVVAGG